MMFGFVVRPVKSHSGAREIIIAGPHHNLIPYAPRSRRRSSLSGVRGGALAENGFYAYMRSERSHLGTPFSVFSNDGKPPNVAGKTSPFPPLSTGLFVESEWANQP